VPLKKHATDLLLSRLVEYRASFNRSDKVMLEEMGGSSTLRGKIGRLGRTSKELPQAGGPWPTGT
jgi:hypothetical protein